MDPLLAISLRGMQAGMARLERVAFNLANVRTVGFKRELQQAQAQPATGAAEAADAAPAPAAVRVDPSPGTLRSTGRALDLALDGPGWFEVATPQGPAYTRQGEFQRDAQGRLVTAQGLPVMGAGGEILLPPGQPFIDAQGRIFDGVPAPGPTGAAQPVAQLRLVQFDPQASLRRVGEGLLAIEGEGLALPAGASSVRQGWLENANVDPLQEMVQLMRALRHFESLQRAAVACDEMLGAALRRLGETG